MIDDPLTLLPCGPLEIAARAMRARLEAVFPPNRFQHDYLPAAMDKTAWEKITRRLPFVGLRFVCIGEPQTVHMLNVLSNWSVFIATKNEASQEALLFGDKYGPGQMQVFSAAAAALHGMRIPDVGTVHVTEANFLFRPEAPDPTMGLSNIELRLPIDLSFTNVVAGDRSADLMRRTITWSFDGGATQPLIDTISGNS